jgi:hypothetical protein
MKRAIFLASLVLVTATSFAQLRDTTIVAKSETVLLKYSPRTPVTQTRITFLKFKDTYGIQLHFLTPNKYIPHIFIESIDSIVMVLSGGNKVILDQPSPDTKYNNVPDLHIFQPAFYIDKAKFDQLRNEKIVEIITSHGSRPLTLRIKRKSQEEVLNVAATF